MRMLLTSTAVNGDAGFSRDLFEVKKMLVR